MPRSPLSKQSNSHRKWFNEVIPRAFCVSAAIGHCTGEVTKLTNKSHVCSACGCIDSLVAKWTGVPISHCCGHEFLTQSVSKQCIPCQSPGFGDKSFEDEAIGRVEGKVQHLLC